LPEKNMPITIKYKELLYKEVRASIALTFSLTAAFIIKKITP
jgi:hypothetical protein